MTKPSDDEAVQLAREVRETFAGGAFSAPIARLYSQHTRLSTGQPPLSHWTLRDSYQRLNDAVRLIEAALVERDAGDAAWTRGMLRGAEILEWLAHPENGLVNIPLRLLAAAAYQLAGYPARAMGLIDAAPNSSSESLILAALLRADFPTLLRRILVFWRQGRQTRLRDAPPSREQPADRINDFIGEAATIETVRAFGVLCSELRWGEETRLQSALKKLRSISSLYLHSNDPYSWLLARLCAEIVAVYRGTSLRATGSLLRAEMSRDGMAVLERYFRSAFLGGRSIAWPSQIAGITRLGSYESFALCTPTGSGKTVVAELAILQALFHRDEDHGVGDDLSGPPFRAPIAMYLVPSRALAGEVEAKLTRAIRRICQPPVVVTGLYGGTDWGPTDAWLTVSDRAVLICTYEKAEALIRFLGPLFVSRLKLLIIDEAHSVNFDGYGVDELRTGDARALRLEMTATRLLSALAGTNARVIALSAVAAGIQDKLASWISLDSDQQPVEVPYRSTRQLVGRLECFDNGNFRIVYDLLDGVDLAFTDQDHSGYPYVPTPFPPYPHAPSFVNAGPEKRMNPYLLWAAMHLAAPSDGRNRAVLISITENIANVAANFATLLEKDWHSASLPAYFSPSPDPEIEAIRSRCRRVFADYFGEGSREFRLLKRGIAIYYSSMPRIVARSLFEAVEARAFSIVASTSSLSEGVNLPFETILVSSLTRRQSGPISIREFANLVGRAGRPGSGTEGRTLVLLLPEPQEVDRAPAARHARQARQTYQALIRQLMLMRVGNAGQSAARSPLGELLTLLYTRWRDLYPLATLQDFTHWLETCAPLTEAANGGAEASQVVELLDSVDAVLLPVIVELEQMSPHVPDDDLEESLKRIWQRTFAHIASRDEKRLSDFFIRRGVALVTNVYPQSATRRQIYRTSLTPISATRLLAVTPTIVAHLRTGRQFVQWTAEEKLGFIQEAIRLLSGVPKFSVVATIGQSRTPWQTILRWWFRTGGPADFPSASQISEWHRFVNQQLVYKVNWGLGSVIALSLDEVYGGELRETSLETWPEETLPWIVFWLKELITWGTLDPVASLLLARGLATDRSEAEGKASAYYQDVITSNSSSDPLDARRIQTWVLSTFRNETSPGLEHLPASIPVNLLRDFSKQPGRVWRVMPVEGEGTIRWTDLAGYALAECARPNEWAARYLEDFDFVLDPTGHRVTVQRFV